MVVYEGLTEYAIKKILDHVMGRAAWTMPTTVYMALFNGDPTGAGTELTAPPCTGYARKAITSSAATFAAPVGTIVNSVDIDFGIAGSAWGTVDYSAIYDQLTGGNMLSSSPLEVVRSIQLDDPAKFPASTSACKVRITRATVP